MARILIVVGTRPEAIKLAPVIQALRERPHFETFVCATGQHVTLVGQTLGHFGLRADIELGHQPGDLCELTASLLVGLGGVLDDGCHDRVLVQGDTCSALAGALAAHYRRIPVGHVEAGLRSSNLASPWPEEANRKLISALADLHFAPTEGAAAALRAENVPGSAIYVTGNTGVDALLALDSGRPTPLVNFAGKRLVLVTCHRRENLGNGMAEVAVALRQLAARRDVTIVLPLHPNPAVSALLKTNLSGCANVHLLDALDYPDFVSVLRHAHIVLTDSGGVQEEAPALGVPVLVLRDTTERPEGIKAGTARLVGTHARRVVAETAQLLDNPAAHARMANAHSPYGDGCAAKRIADIVTFAHGYGEAAGAIGE